MEWARDTAVMSRHAVQITLTADEEQVLRQRAALRNGALSVVMRARLVLAASQGETNQDMAQRVGLTVSRVRYWRRRFATERLAGLEDRPRSGRPATYTDADRVRVVEMACTKPPATTHWSVRDLAKATGVGRETVHRLLRRADLKPHRVGTFSRSTDPEFVAKLTDVIGLYLDPPEHAIVLCADEKTQVQALDRTQPRLPMRPKQIERHTHDYKRHGTVQLYAALEVATGQVTAHTTKRHRSKEFIGFLETLLSKYPEGRLHVVLDNVSSHHSAEVQAWHAQTGHDRITFHPVPTYSSWLNVVEIFFNTVQAKVISRGDFRSTKDLVERIMAYIDQFNAEGRIFHWTKSAAAILQSLNYATGH
jgi:transposase